jgi:hypothetical protein
LNRLLYDAAQLAAADAQRAARAWAVGTKNSVAFSIQLKEFFM